MLFSWHGTDAATGYDFRINIIPAGDEPVYRDSTEIGILIPDDVITITEIYNAQADIILGMGKTPYIKLEINTEFMEDNENMEILEGALCMPIVEKTLTLEGNTFFNSIVYETGTIIELWIRYTSEGGTVWHKKFIGLHTESVGDVYDSSKNTFEITIEAASRIAVEAVDFTQITKTMNTGTSAVPNLYTYYMRNNTNTEAWECFHGSKKEGYRSLDHYLAGNQDEYLEDYFIMANTADVLDAFGEVAEALFNAMTRQIGVAIYNTYPDVIWYKQSYGLTDTRGAVIPFNQLYSIMYTHNKNGEISGGLLDTQGKSSVLTKYGNFYDLLNELFEGTDTVAIFTTSGIKTYGYIYPNNWGTKTIDSDRVGNIILTPTAKKLGQIYLVHWEYNEGDIDEKIFHYKGAGQNDLSYTIPVFINNADVIPDKWNSGQRTVNGVKINWYYIDSEEDDYRGHFGNLFYYDLPENSHYETAQFFMVHPRPKFNYSDTYSTDDVTEGALGTYNRINDYTLYDKSPKEMHLMWQLFLSMSVGAMFTVGNIYKSRVPELMLEMHPGDFVTDGATTNPYLEPHLGTVEFDCTQLRRKFLDKPRFWRIQESLWDVVNGKVKLKLLPEKRND